MNNLIQNYEIILEELKNTCTHIDSIKQIRIPKLSDLELVALIMTAEYVSINSELQLFRFISGSVLEHRIERSVFNKKRRMLFSYLEKIRIVLSSKFSEFTDVFVVGSTPIEICKVSRAMRSAISSTEQIRPAFGYCAAQKSRYFGFKLHAVCYKNGIFHSYDFSPANIHDVNYLNDIKEKFKNWELIGDRGYTSKELQVDLFNYSNLNLSVPMRKNQHGFVRFSYTKSKIRKRIETAFSQLAGQFTINVNFANSFEGLAVRILSKIASLTMIQYLNFFIFKRSLNKIKINLC